jgi:hypothetical protein
MKKQVQRVLVVMWAMAASTVAVAETQAVDLSAIVEAASMETVITGVLAVAAVVAGLLVVQRAVYEVQNFLIAREATREAMEYERDRT